MPLFIRTSSLSSISSLPSAVTLVVFDWVITTLPTMEASMAVNSPTSNLSLALRVCAQEVLLTVNNTITIARKVVVFIFLSFYLFDIKCLFPVTKKSKYI